MTYSRHELQRMLGTQKCFKLRIIPFCAFPALTTDQYLETQYWGLETHLHGGHVSLTRQLSYFISYLDYTHHQPHTTLLAKRPAGGGEEKSKIWHSLSFCFSHSHGRISMASPRTPWPGIRNISPWGETTLRSVCGKSECSLPAKLTSAHNTILRRASHTVWQRETTSHPGQRLSRSRRARQRASMPWPAQQSRLQRKRAIKPRPQLQSRPTKPRAFVELTPSPALPKHNGRAQNPQLRVRLRRERRKSLRKAQTKIKKATTPL